MKLSLYTFVIILLAFFTGCENNNGSDNPGGEPSGDLAEQVQAHNQNDEFEDALDLLREADQNDNEVQQMQETIHMNYALYLTYEAEHLGMTERMPDALRHYRRVLEFNPDHEQAQEEIDQIEGIYEQLGRDIPEGVAE